MFRSPYDREFEQEQEIEHKAYQRGASSILNKIITEISAHLSNAEKDSKRTQDDIDCGICIGLQMALDTINKYKTESEEI